MRPYDAYIFDFDGTLADTFALRQESWRAALAEADIKYLPDQLSEALTRGLSNQQIVAALTRRQPSTEAVEAVCRFKDRWRVENLDRIKLFPEVGEVMTALRGQGARLAICSRNQRSVVTQVLESARQRSGFSVLVARDSDQTQTDHVTLLSRAADAVGEGSRHILFVGDTPHDRQSAREAGLKFVRIARDGISDPEDSLSIHSLRQLVSSSSTAAA